MDRLLKLDVDEYVAAMRMEIERMLREIGQAVNNAPEGNVISGSEVAVREALRELGRRAFERAVQMRIDATEGAFSPSQGRPGPGDEGQGARVAQHQHAQRPH